MFDKNYQRSQQVTYRGMIWLLATQLIVMLPFALHLPIWLLPVMLASAYWRIRVIRGHSAQPKFVVRIMIIALGLLGLVASGPIFSLNTMVSLLLLGFAFKSLEVIRQRDALVVIFVGYFLVAISFLFSQSILAAVYSVVSLVILTSALIVNQQSPAQQRNENSTRSSLKLAGLMLLQSIPLMALVFIFMPRFSPMWVIPSFAGQAKSGVSDRMSPGDIANLSKSDGLAFRASFKDRKPQADEMYWRGLVLNHFDGVSWQQFEKDYDPYTLRSTLAHKQPWKASQVTIEGEPITYEAIYEKTGQPWLFTLTPTTQIDGKTQKMGDYRVMSKSDLQAPMLLNATSYPDALRDVTLSEFSRHLTLQLPNGNPQTRAMAKQWRSETESDQAYIDKILSHYNTQPFFYTLRPPVLGSDNTIDKFLFESQRGFCSHYSGSFVFLMRAAGIPARVVVGYLGGEWNTSGEYLSVHQYDAHAWTEVWLKGKGWVRVDPTSMVAPTRVEGGLEAALEEEGSFLEGNTFSARHFKGLDSIRHTLDSLQYGWRRWILGYDSDSQKNLLKTLLDKTSAMPLALLVGLLFIGIFLLWFVMLGLVGKRNNEAYEHRLYRKFCKRLEKKGIVRLPSQTASEFATIASKQLPQQQDAIRSFSLLYQKHCYETGTSSDKASTVRTMKQLLRGMR